MPALISALLGFILLTFIKVKVQAPVMLILDRFLPGGGWIEILLLSLYAGWIAEKMTDPSRISKIRKMIWSLFSLVFFTQLLLGLTLNGKFLMTGETHLPVPAMIIAGPVFRGGSLFMLILFFSKVLICGPAWCSYLCYIGAWDNLAAGGRDPQKSFKRIKWLQAFNLFMVVVLAYILGRLGGMNNLATWLGGSFGILGLIVMWRFSRQKGVMVHCTGYCPIGLLANLFGRVNPFRVTIADSCTDCSLCTRSCKYNALERDHITARKPGLNCTLCGDCISSCPSGSLQYRFPGLSAQSARRIFLVLMIVLHTVFMGVARL
jgi:NAD-dependent dihydropyrimidine dehydrogenase PreA subunit